MSDDVALVQRCLAGDEVAMRAFTAKYQNLVFSLCLKMLRHREDAEDVAQRPRGVTAHRGRNSLSGG